MKQKIFGFGMLVLFVLEIAFPTFVLGAILPTVNECKVQVQVNEIYLSSDGGATWSSNILSSPSDYITFEPGSSTSIFSYFAQNVQVSAGTYNYIKVVLNPVVKAWFKATGQLGVFYTKENTTPFDQEIGQYIGGGANTITDQAASGYWYMRLTSPKETIEQALNLTITDGQAVTISVEIYNNFTIIGGSALDCATTDANPRLSTLIVVQ